MRARQVQLERVAAFVLAIAVPGRAQETLRLPATRDTWLSGVGPEADGNNGAAPRLKLQTMTGI